MYFLLEVVSIGKLFFFGINDIMEVFVSFKGFLFLEYKKVDFLYDMFFFVFKKE